MSSQPHPDAQVGGYPQRLPLAVLVLCSLAAVLIPVSGAEPAGAAPASAPLTVVNVSSHCDWSWGHSRAWHEERYAQILHDVLGIMREAPGYVWQLENLNEELEPFLARADARWPGLTDEFWRRVREGRIEMVVGVSNPRLTEVYPETIVRNMVLSREWFARRLPGFRQPVYQAVDLMCGPSQMPQVLEQAGHRYFMFSRPIGRPAASTAVFRRRGPDGTRLLCARSFYAHRNEAEIAATPEGFVPVPVRRLAVGGDDVLPEPALAREAAHWDPKQKILATVTRYFEEVEKHGSGIRELGGVLDSLECYVEAGLHGARSLYMRNNQDEDLLLAMEKAQAMAGAISSRVPDKAATDVLWRDLLSCVGHAIQWSWAADYAERLRFAEWRSTRIEAALAEALGEVSAAIRFRRDLGAPLVVFNFHAWPVTGPVEFALEDAPRGLTLRDGFAREIPLAVAPAGAGGAARAACFVAKDVPACGYRTYYLAAATAAAPAPGESAGPGPIANEFYRAEAGPDGALEIRDAKDGTPLAPSGVGGLGAVVFRDAPVSKDWRMNGPLGEARPWRSEGGRSCRVVRTPVYESVATAGRWGAHRAERELRLWRGCRRLDLRVAIDAAAGDGVFCFRFPLHQPGRVMAGAPFGAEPRERFEAEPFRGEFFVEGYPNGYWATRWTDVSNGGSGLAFVCPPGAHTGYSYEAAPPALEFILLRVRGLPEGLWGRMHPSIKGGGMHRFRCALVPHAGAWNDAAVHRHALETHLPLLAFSPELGLRRARPGAPSRSGAAGVRPEAASFVEIVGPSNVVLSAWRVVGSGGADAPAETELRIYETTGRSTDATIRLAENAGRVRQTDFLGRPVAHPARVETIGREIRVGLAPWKIVTLRMSR